MIGYETPPRRDVGTWLLVCFVLVLGLVVIGGLTRLTGSGLSIVEWKPVTGIVPPLSEADWGREFAAYKDSPEYRLVNAGMSLEAFKRIYWFEFIHRLWGRFIGVALVLPLAYFALRRRIDTLVTRRIGGLVLLGAGQGAVGWYMVQSGLESVPSVSAIRLTLHLTMALALSGLLLWTALDELRGTRPRRRQGGQVGAVRALVLFSGLTIASGGLVAGTHAGRNYNSFPLMAGKLVPDGLLALTPWWRNFVESVLTVQFQHRVLALALCGAALVVALKLIVSHPRSSQPAARAVVFMALLQPALGIATLLLHVPLSFAALHQLGGFLFFSALVWLAHERRHPAG